MILIKDSPTVSGDICSVPFNYSESEYNFCYFESDSSLCSVGNTTSNCSQGKQKFQTKNLKKFIIKY